MSTVLERLKEHVDAVAEDFALLADRMKDGDQRTGREGLATVYRALMQLIREAEAVRNFCPACSGPNARMQWEAVNKLSGVWKRPQCDECRPLSELLTAAEKVAASAPPELA